MNTVQIRNENGVFIPIRTIRGAEGKSAYKQAKEGGYTGTEEEFVQILGSLGNINAVQATDVGNACEEHIANRSNPHNVTAEQVGAFSASGGTVSGDVKVYSGHHPMVKIGCDDSNTASFFYTQNKTVDIYNWTNGEPTTISLGNVNSMLLRDVCKLWVGPKDYQIYGDHNASELGIAKIATGTYVGTGAGGATNPNTLTFPFKPKAVFIALTGKSDRCDATLPLMYGSGIGLVYSSTSSNWSTHSVYPINLVWEDNTLAFTYTLSTTSVEQRQLNISEATYKWVIWG